MAITNDLLITNKPVNYIMDEDAIIYRVNKEVVISTMLPALIFLMILMIVGIVGNLLVFYIFVYRVRMGTQDFLIIVLTSFDFLSCMVAMPGEIMVLMQPYTMQSEFVCRLVRFSNAYCTLGSIIMLVLIGLDRFQKVCRPYRRQMSMHHVKWSVLPTMVVSLILAIPSPIIFGIGRMSVEVGQQGQTLIGYRCTISDAFKKSKFPLVYNSVFFLLFIVILVLLTVIYSRIWGQMKRHARIVATEAEKDPYALCTTTKDNSSYSAIAVSLKRVRLEFRDAGSFKPKRTMSNNPPVASSPSSLTSGSPFSDSCKVPVSSSPSLTSAKCSYFSDRAFTVAENNPGYYGRQSRLTPAWRDVDKQTTPTTEQYVHAGSERKQYGDEGSAQERPKTWLEVDSAGTLIQNDQKEKALEQAVKEGAPPKRHAEEYKTHTGTQYAKEQDQTSVQLSPVSSAVDHSDHEKVNIAQNKDHGMFRLRDISNIITDYVTHQQPASTSSSSCRNLFSWPSVLTTDCIGVQISSDESLKDCTKPTVGTDHTALSKTEKEESAMNKTFHAQCADAVKSTVTTTTEPLKDTTPCTTTTEPLKDTTPCTTTTESLKDTTPCTTTTEPLKDTTPCTTTTKPDISRKTDDQKFSHISPTSAFSTNKSTTQAVPGFTVVRSISKVGSFLKSKRSQKVSQKGTIIAMSVTVVFFLSFIPSLTLLTLKNTIIKFDRGAGAALYHMFVRSNFINSVSNPIVYGMLNARFRTECINMLRWARGKSRESSSNIVRILSCTNLMNSEFAHMDN